MIYFLIGLEIKFHNVSVRSYEKWHELSQINNKRPFLQGLENLYT